MTRSTSVSAALSQLGSETSETTGSSFSTGFRLLDGYLNGGLRAGDLALVGGRQGLGKTTFVLQVCRHLAHEGVPTVLLSFEHDAAAILERLMTLELAEHVEVPPSAREVAQTLRRHGAPREHDADAHPDLVRAAAAVREWGQLVVVHESGGDPVTLDHVRRVVTEATRQFNRTPLLVVDYLQKLAVDGETDAVRSGQAAVGLKELAMGLRVPVLAIAAADREGLTPGRRLRVQHLRGADVLAYEADVVLLFNDKYDIVARQHLVFDTANAQRWKDYVVLSVEKNRSGIDGVDLEFRKQFMHHRFDPDGAVVTEQLVDERLYVE